MCNVTLGRASEPCRSLRRRAARTGGPTQGRPPMFMETETSVHAWPKRVFTGSEYAKGTGPASFRVYPRGGESVVTREPAVDSVWR